MTSKQDANSDVPPSSSASILLVDDDPQFRAALKRGLSSKGYRVATASSAEEALEVLLSLTVDVVVTDLRMGARSGLDLIRAVGSRYPSTRSILMSGDILTTERDEALALGAASVLDKPFTPYDLARAVDAAVAQVS